MVSLKSAFVISIFALFGVDSERMPSACFLPRLKVGYRTKAENYIIYRTRELREISKAMGKNWALRQRSVARVRSTDCVSSVLQSGHMYIQTFRRFA